jgi:polyhydroxyalkanoate synthesis regulator phasin
VRAAAASTGSALRDGDAVSQLVGALRDQLSDRVFEPLNLVLLAADRIQEALDDAVERGRVTRGDANDLVSELVRRGREQTDDVLGNLDELLGRGVEQLEALSRKLDRARRSDQVSDRVFEPLNLVLLAADRIQEALDRARRSDQVDRLIRGADAIARRLG